MSKKTDPHPWYAEGQWVRIRRVELEPPERALGIPSDTAAVPFETRVCGWLVDQARVGECARVRTVTGRILQGELIEPNPGYSHTFGWPPQPLQQAWQRARELLLSGQPP